MAATATGRRYVALVGLVIAALAGVARATDWEQIGPQGGSMVGVGVGLIQGELYAAATAGVPGQVIFYASADNGLRWQRRGLIAGCVPPVDIAANGVRLSVISAETIVADCATSYVSRDGGRHWTLYSPADVAGQLSPDALEPQRAAYRARWRLSSTSAEDALYVTEDGGATWVRRTGDVLPDFVVFDPQRPGRMVGITAPFPPQGETRFVHESFDLGRSWQYLSTVDGGECAWTGLLVDRLGTLYRWGSCGVMTAEDGGVQWTVRTSPLGATQVMAMDRARPGHLFAWTSYGLAESFNSGGTWATLPLPSRFVPRIDAFGDLWVASDGVHLYDRATGSFDARNTGIDAAATSVVERAPSAVLALGSNGLIRRADGDGEWSVVRPGEADVHSLYPNVYPGGSTLAYVADGRLFGTDDGGATWTLLAVASGGQPAQSTPYQDLVPVGPQPGVIYARFRPFGPQVACCEAVDIARSFDGGRNWIRTLAPAGTGMRLHVGRADPATLFALGPEGVYRSRDGGTRWDRVASAVAPDLVYVPDPVDAARWYRVGGSGRVEMSLDVGTTWTDASLPYMATGAATLTIDAATPQRLMLVHADGGVSLSEDRGAHWRRAVSPSPYRNVVTGRVRPQAGDGGTLHVAAAQGVLRVALGSAPQPVPVAAVEYYHPRLDHYFITADPGEMAGLDAAMATQRGFVRTGLAFEVWPAGTATTSPVCRFYAPPSVGIDSHFFSASPAECAEVRERFPGIWIYETPDAFVAGLPATTDGSCTTGSGVFRLFNGRANANHRYTTSTAVRAAMIQAGWIAEGYGVEGVAMCTAR